MRSHADGSVNIQTTSEAKFSTPAWFGKVVLLSRYLQKHGVLRKINEQVRFALKRFGRDVGHRFSRGALRSRWLRIYDPGLGGRRKGGFSGSPSPAWPK